jgi:hypothetical protein
VSSSFGSSFGVVVRGVGNAWDSTGLVGVPCSGRFPSSVRGSPSRPAIRALTSNKETHETRRWPKPVHDSVRSWKR